MTDEKLILECPCDSCEHSFDGCELGCSKLLKWYVEVQQKIGDDSGIVKITE